MIVYDYHCILIIPQYGLVEHCKYENLRTEMIKNRVVVGLRDRKLSERLQLEADLTLEKP